MYLIAGDDLFTFSEIKSVLNLNFEDYRQAGDGTTKVSIIYTRDHFLFIKIDNLLLLIQCPK